MNPPPAGRLAGSIAEDHASAPVAAGIERHADTASAPSVAPTPGTATPWTPECVVLSGICPERAVAMAETLLGHGKRVAIDVTHSPALGRALGSRIDGVVCVGLSARRPSRPGAVASRLRDLLFALAGLVLTAPLLCGLAFLVKRSSPGPALFSTTVIGRDGRPFTWRKLRSMRAGPPEEAAHRRERYRAYMADRDDDAGQNRMRKIVDESRVTAIGRVMRRHSLDELPQLWNVLTGDMTLVGPRPCLPYEYELQKPWHRLRYRATPGLTGPWQAYGRSRMTFDEMAMLDYCYGHVRSFWLDLRLILRTIVVVVTGEGGK